MDVEALRSEMEEDFAWRVDEMRLFQNACENIAAESDRDRFRKALVVILYANFEGFAKLVFSTYVAAVNSAAIECKDASLSIAAASLADVFRYLRDGGGKVPELKGMDLPDDTALHKFARDREFLAKALDFLDRPVLISEKVVQTESNLGRDVLRKILYRLGLPHDVFKELELDIEKLRNLRNNIAHGGAKAGISEKDYQTLRSSTLKVMRDLMIGVTQALNEGWYLQKPTRTAAA